MCSPKLLPQNLLAVSPLNAHLLQFICLDVLRREDKHSRIKVKTFSYLLYQVLFEVESFLSCLSQGNCGKKEIQESRPIKEK